MSSPYPPLESVDVAFFDESGLMSQAVLPTMFEQGDGAIVNIGGVSGHIGCITGHGCKDTTGARR